ncbi:MAG: hypothetical protein NC935_00705 [Candidatus Omnitrophica bacterium]|nr:hypothetical protein [Candidatus Omnitrophota bacterium]
MSDILLVYASFGEGHKIAAISLEKFLNAPSYDLLDFSSNFVKKFFSYSYINITQNMPNLWRLLFYGTKNKRIQKSIEKINLFLANKFLLYLKKTKPKIIITTHFFPLYFIAKAKKEFPLKVIAIVTDLAAHPLWVNTCVDRYFVATKQTKEELISYNVETDKIISGYVPLREGFLEKLNEKNLRKKFFLDDKPCLLFMSSLRGKFPYLRGSIKKLKDNFNIFIICGRNKKLKNYFSKLKCPSVKLFLKYENIWELFYLSSAIITKPGGLTVFEGLYMKKPFIFTSFIPGQEKENMDFLIKHGVARFAKSKKQFLNAIDYFAFKNNFFKQNYPIEVRDIRDILKKNLIQLLKAK